MLLLGSFAVIFGSEYITRIWESIIIVHVVLKTAHHNLEKWSYKREAWVKVD